jgi:threonine dehydrogenase-like Zn-dependent dehydrogenase
MRAVAVFPGERRVALVSHPEPRVASAADVKIRMLEVGVCGTDRELCAFEFGSAPAGCEYFVLGHESLGEVVETGPDVRGLRRGDLVVGTVRFPCGKPGCGPCRAGRQDFCATGAYSERGIKDRHGFMTGFVVEEERNLHRLAPELRDVGVLVEPLTIAEKAVLELRAIESRMPWRRETRRAVVMGAGPVGLLGAMALVEAGYETWVYSRSRAPNPKAEIAEAIGAEYVSSAVETAERFAARLGVIDVVYEAAGAPQAAFDLMRHMGPNTVFILTGVPRPDERLEVDMHALAFNLVLHNQVVMGTVNAGPDAFAAAVRDLAAFAARWPKALRSLITGRFPLERYDDAIQAGGIKNVIALE